MRTRIFRLIENAYAHIVLLMNPMQHIRLNVLKISQSEMARVVGRDQATVSRWERGALEPSRDDLEKIREHARSRRIRWDDCLFFEAPDSSVAPPRGKPAPAHPSQGAA
ncbi:helix-turn-helix domain-containing protein [Azospirillum brasilense]|uniref:helix-turn-helix domain-containing protein n=1 Tax=Azospirillum brasilense TaxID=192 RepID=UPI000E6A076C|nr:helix-turn-helix transcriptional regulator [Azospirillum brasilense]NUB26261.1 helix-turn-helix domain-containing protein [Azospirillum brasilense]NUB34227.1 helix-turn-helix domain-containing protein [Azospirillum brasilense]RIV99257.1 XRE family transcriptional regulator [Azospirillum brasilense]